MAQNLSLPTEITAQSFDGLTLTPEEEQSAILKALEEKRTRLKQDETKLARERLHAHMLSKWDHKQMLDFVVARAWQDYQIDFQIDKSNAEVLKLLCYYTTNNPIFEKRGQGFSLHKGLVIMGNVGTGKTTLMKLFSRNQKQSFLLTPCRKITELYEVDGEEAVTSFSAPVQESGTDIRFFNQRVLGQCFDDLGTEKNPVLHFGNRTNVMTNVILNRYDSRRTMPHTMTHITTNLDAAMLDEQYGSRVKSRLREMFNVIVLEGSDRRK